MTRAWAPLPVHHCEDGSGSAGSGPVSGPAIIFILPGSARTTRYEAAIQVNSSDLAVIPSSQVGLLKTGDLMSKCCVVTGI